MYRLETTLGVAVVLAAVFLTRGVRAEVGVVNGFVGTTFLKVLEVACAVGRGVEVEGRATTVTCVFGLLLTEVVALRGAG